MSGRILIVDDDDTIREMLRLFLANQGYFVEEAEGFIAAQGLLENNDYEVILLDKNMPGLNDNPEGGMDLLRYIRSQCLGPEVIMITGLATVETAIEAMKLGAFDYIQKPLRMVEIRDKVKRLIEYHKFINPEFIFDAYRTARANILELMQLRIDTQSEDAVEETMNKLNSTLDNLFKMFKDVEGIVLVMRKSLMEIASTAESLCGDIPSSNCSKALIEGICRVANNNL